jgi:hypothetical protein
MSSLPLPSTLLVFLLSPSGVRRPGLDRQFVCDPADRPRRPSVPDLVDVSPDGHHASCCRAIVPNPRRHGEDCRGVILYL